MANTDDTSKKQPASDSSDVSAATSRLEQTLEAERARLIQIHSVVHCLYEVLLYAEGDEAGTVRGGCSPRGDADRRRGRAARSGSDQAADRGGSAQCADAGSLRYPRASGAAAGEQGG